MLTSIVPRTSGISERNLDATRHTIRVEQGKGAKDRDTVLQDSDVAMRAYLLTVKAGEDFLQLLNDDEESAPCVKREWVLNDFPDRELIGLAADAWARVGGLLGAARERIGLPPIDLSLGCRHSADKVQIRTYDRAVLRQWLEQISSRSLTGRCTRRRAALSRHAAPSLAALAQRG